MITSLEPADSATSVQSVQSADSLFARHVPVKELPKFYALQQRNQERIRLLFDAFHIIESAPTLGLGYDQACADLGTRLGRGLSPANLRRIYSTWRKTRDWRDLIDQALEYKPAAGMPQAFLDHLQERCDANIRSIQAALKKIRAAWVAGESIPGYGTWREHWMRQHPGRNCPRTCPGWPNGWSPENLRRKLDTSKFRRKALTIGRTAATSHRPTVLTTRKGCYVHSHIMWDDVWHDHFVNSIAQCQAGRPLELFAHDFYSARKVRYGIKVRTEDDTGKSEGLTARMMRMIVAATYYMDGYSARGTVNVAEHGTAAFDEEMERVLYDATGGLVTVQRSGLTGNAAHVGQYNGRRIGNPRFKASLESSNNLVHNLLADLPGQTGPNRERRPEQLDGLLKYNGRLLAAMQQLPSDVASLLQFPLLELTQFHQVLAAIYSFMESDREHDLEGWVECGHVMQCVELLGEWRTQDELMMLPEGQREMALAMISSGLCRAVPRKMSRLEVWQRGSRDLIRVPGGVVCQLLGRDLAQERKVKGHQFSFEDAEVGPGEHRFEGIILDAEGRSICLPDGDTFETFVNPFSPDELFVRDAKGRYLGSAQRIQRVTRGDVDTLARAMGHARHVESELLKPLQQRQAKEARKKLAMHRNNAGVLKSVADQRADFTRQATAALAASAAPDTEPDTEPAW